MSNQSLNTLTHGLGLAACGVAVCMVDRSGAIGIYLATLIAVYLFSSLSHALTGPSRQTFERLDKGCIFLLIAGTYTPIMVACCYHAVGVFMLSLIWMAALLGFVGKVWYKDESIWPYVALGWAPVVLGPQMLFAVPVVPLVWVILGGIAYTAGLFFFLRDERYGFHAIWHLFVMLGSALHFVAIMGLQ